MSGKGHCIECRKPTDRLGPRDGDPPVSVFLCADCEWKRERPGTPRRLSLPSELPPAPLQGETLFPRSVA